MLVSVFALYFLLYLGADIPPSLVVKRTHLSDSVARLVYYASRYDHITPLLTQLHWLDVPERISTSIWPCAAPQTPTSVGTVVYFADFFSNAEALQRLSAASSSSCVVRRNRISTVDDRAFPTAA